jgi:hypothetical protein
MQIYLPLVRRFAPLFDVADPALPDVGGLGTALSKELFNLPRLGRLFVVEPALLRISTFAGCPTLAEQLLVIMWLSDCGPLGKEANLVEDALIRRGTWLYIARGPWLENIAR